MHQIRSSLKYVASKDQKEFMKDLKKVNWSVNKKVAEDELLNLEEKWGGKYPVVMESWQHNWKQLSQYFEYSEPIKEDHIHHQCSRGLPPTDPKGNQNQRSFH